MATVKPITPADVHVHKTMNAPDGVMEAWNEIIAENYDCGYSKFTQKELINRILQKMEPAGFKRLDVLDRGWLNLEPLFEKAGWSVEYDKPGFNENYPENFTFRARRAYREGCS